MSAAAPPKLIGAYEVLGKIAEGGMGAVYKARHPGTGELVAIKVVPAETAKNPLLLKRFEQEFRAASLIDHPNVVKAIEYGAGASPFLVMEFVDGESLGQTVDRVGRLSEAEAVRLLGQVCEGLHRAHKQGLIHRDVKPDNILVTRDGVAKITDLGLVKDVEAETNLTRTGRGLGTPHFMAPEQFRNAKHADVRCDVYSLGATLYCLVTGLVPFANTSPLDCWMKKTKSDFPTPKEVVPAIGERVDWAIRRAMHHDPAQRPANCREFMEDLTGMTWRGQASGSFVTPAPAAGRPAELPPPAPADPSDLWYMVYRLGSQQKTVKGTTESIRRNVAGGLVGSAADILVSRTKQGQFRPLRDVPEFRDLGGPPPLNAPTPVPPARVPPSGRYVVAPDAAASLSGSFSRAPTEDLQPTHAAAGDQTQPFDITPFTAPPAERRPPARMWPMVVIAMVAALTGVVVTLLVSR